MMMDDKDDDPVKSELLCLIKKLNEVYVNNNTFLIASPRDSQILISNYRMLLQKAIKYSSSGSGDLPERERTTFYFCYRLNDEQVKRVNRRLKKSPTCSKVVLSERVMRSVCENIPTLCKEIVDEELHSNCILCSLQGNGARMKMWDLSRSLDVGSLVLTAHHTHANAALPDLSLSFTTGEFKTLRYAGGNKFLKHVQCCASYPKIVYNFGWGDSPPPTVTKARVCCLLYSLQAATEGDEHRHPFFFSRCSSSPPPPLGGTCCYRTVEVNTRIRVLQVFLCFSPLRR